MAKSGMDTVINYELGEVEKDTSELTSRLKVILSMHHFRDLSQK